jgi:hypothetical protein
MYAPMTVFMTLGIVLALAGTGIGVRYLVFFFTDSGAGHVQSLLLAVLLLVIGFLAAMLGLLADLVAGNRRLLEEIVWRVRALETRPRAGVKDVEPPSRSSTRRHEVHAPPEA